MKARRRVALLTEVLKQYGIGEERFYLRWIAASEGNMLKEIAIDMTSKLKQLGPSPLRNMSQMAL
jgi:F420-non-reducing hydrogenase iron-sulfur subunit